MPMMKKELFDDFWVVFIVFDHANAGQNSQHTTQTTKTKYLTTILASLHYPMCPPISSFITQWPMEKNKLKKVLLSVPIAHNNKIASRDMGYLRL